MSETSQKNALWKPIAYLLIGMVFFCVFYFGLKQVLIGWEAHSPLFRYSASYINEFRGEIWGPLLYVQNFLIQFSYYPALGAAIYALLLTLIAWTLNTAVGVKRPEQTAIGFAVTACLLPVFPHTFMIWPLIFLAIGLGGAIWRNTSHILFRGPYLVFLVFFIREYILVAWLFYTLIDFVNQKTAVAVRRTALYTLVMAVLCCIGVWVWQPYVFFSQGWRFGNIERLIGPHYMNLPFIYFFFTPLAKTVFFSAFGLLVLSPLTAFAKGKITQYILFALALLIAGFSFGITPAQAHRHNVFFAVDSLCRQHKWQEALHILNKEYAQHSEAPKISYNDMLYEAQLKTCLLATRRASGEIFTYRLSSFPFLFPITLENQPEYYVTAVYYAYAGSFSESLHQNYDLITAQNYSPVVMREIIKTSLILGDTLPASKFVHIMQCSLFRAKEARRLFAGQDPEAQAQIERGKTLIPSVNYAVNAYTPDRTAHSNFLYQSKNPLFLEYHLVLRLLDKNPSMFIYLIDVVKEYYPQGMPRHMQEALLSVGGYSPVAATAPDNIEGIDAETRADFALFALDNLKFQRDEISFSELMRKWSHTYWFYDLCTTELPNPLKNRRSHEKQPDKPV